MTVAQSHIQVHTDFFVTIPYNYVRHMKHFQDFITIYYSNKTNNKKNLEKYGK